MVMIQVSSLNKKFLLCLTGSNAFFITLVWGVVSIIAAVSTFGNNKSNFRREFRLGMNISSYFVANNVFDLLNIGRNALLFMAIYQLLLLPAGSLFLSL